MTRLLLVNSSDMPLNLLVTPQADFPAGNYTVSYPMNGQLLLSPSGAKLWSRQELEKMELCLDAGAERLLELSAGKAEPTGMTEIKYVEPPRQTVAVTPVETIDEITLDGKLDANEWKNVVVRQLESCVGGARPDAPKVRLAVNSKHDTLYIAAEFKAKVITAVHSGHDSSVWNDDCIEIFLTSVGNDKYYQFAVNAINAYYDGCKMDGKWNVKEFHSATSRTEDGWCVEIAIPLEQFGFTTAVELNLVTTIVSTGKRRSLYPVGSQNHLRSAMHPVVWK